MVTAQIRKLEVAKARLADLQKSVATHLEKELAGLPGAYGFDSAREFTAAVTAAAARRGSAGRGPKGAAVKPRRKRSVITDETRALVKKLAEAGKTGAHIAAAVGISLPSVQNIKKALGLVKARK